MKKEYSIYNNTFVIYELSPALTSTVTPVCTSRNVIIYLLPVNYAPLWIQSEAKGMNKAGYKT